MTNMMYAVTHMDDDKKERILTEATGVFERFGYRKASVDDIAQAAGVAKGTVYLMCKSKEDLFFQVLNREIRLWMGAVSLAIDPRKSADELLPLLSERSFEQMKSRPLVRELLHGKVAGYLPHSGEALERLRGMTLSNIMELLRLGVSQGVFRPGVDTLEVAQVVRDIPIATYLFYSDDSPEAVKRRRDRGVDLVLNGLRARTK